MDLSSRPPLAGIPVRFAAVLLDGLIQVVVLVPLALGSYLAFANVFVTLNETMLGFSVILILVGSVLLNCYSALVLAMWAYGLTPGKWMLGIRVVHRDTVLAAGFWRMLLREVVGRLVAGVLCYLGYLWVFFDANRQGWHDKIASTLVIRTR